MVSLHHLRFILSSGNRSQLILILPIPSCSTASSKACSSLYSDSFPNASHRTPAKSSSFFLAAVECSFPLLNRSATWTVTTDFRVEGCASPW